ncbi:MULTISPECIES: protein-disulfide reductase DsbD [unclassified Pseudomonas]|uniref:protein-disulfide reductase DsbD n=1 Tax=unclassified Pseudomonas TaxID=196821 RepID=UPI000C87D409|nr:MULTISPECIES: protein-disulfide reductase DsbD [unclassified Pseudomonas]PMU10904.1 thiol:disulfide interchange protein [Pseudomonas sp. FW305-20]PMU20480.1 thiol:disulfide interchange protein [Pseudomonas sp. FW305-122]PMU40074.1 thiol:disulfide interchange protein [Pseudomonas sp. FW305-47B]PMX63491.1 thiol:disulfide interchange protein [Pseudomonas sp. FW305-33]PMX66570.1 thiol:disulfide interchange protein [Pseudomonas sp. FW305-60]
MRRLFLFFALLISGVAQAGTNPFETKPDFLPVEKAFVFTSERLESGETQLYWQIADGYYLYQKRLKFDGLPAEQHPALPEGEAHSDEFFGEQQVYRQGLELKIAAGATGQIKVGFQGCADAGLCYPPHTQVVDLGGTSAIAATDEAPDQALASGLQQRALGWSLLVFFGLGLLLAFTPCSLPMLPILAGLIVGSGATPKRGFALATSYVVSMALVYAAMGVLASMLGANLQALLQNPWLLGSFAAVFVLLALPMFGFFELQLPVTVRDRLENVSRNQRGGSLFGAGVLGALSGLLVGPCMTAPLAGALLYIAQSGNALHGGLILFVMGIGIGVPLLLLVTVGNRFLPKPGAWMNLLKGVFGFLFLATALLMLRPVLDESLWIGLCGGLLLIAAYSAWKQSEGFGRVAHVFGASSLLLGVWGSLLMIGAAGGSDDLMKPLQVYSASNSSSAAYPVGHDAFTTIKDPTALQRELDAAQAQGQWVLLDYYADWCVSCKVMEKQVFGKAHVLEALSDVRLLRLDVTADNAASRELLGRYKVPGPPSLLWIGADGIERRSQRITGEVDAGTFLQRWTTTRDAR